MANDYKQNQLKITEILEHQAIPFSNMIMFGAAISEPIPSDLIAYFLTMFSNKGFSVGHSEFYFVAYVLIGPLFLIYKRFDEVITYY